MIITQLLSSTVVYTTMLSCHIAITRDMVVLYYVTFLIFFCVLVLTKWDWIEAGESLGYQIALVLSLVYNVLLLFLLFIFHIFLP